MRMLVIGDTHIPRRASWLPEEVEKFINSQKFDIVACTGDLTDKSVLDYFSNLAKKFVVVRGNMDHLPLPEYETLEIDEIKMGLIHGDQVYPRGNRSQLIKIAKKLNVDVLISGHTHSPDIYKEDVLLLNPGSATGVWGGGGGSLKPSFMVLNVEGSKIDVELYELEDVLKCTQDSFIF
ncbi:MAG: YfcE family phosphodiesterase [Archaeoglobales archaeon]|nr:MAG: YfcE family phosphodiesterase [Archaeoglobales archaeon]